MFTVGILVSSDKGSRGERLDESGQVIRKNLARLPAEVVRHEVVPDDEDAIAAVLIDWADNQRLDLIITSGGTGLSPRDVTPEATLRVLDRLAPGFAEAMRRESFKKTPHAMLSRAVAGTRGRTLIINMPGSPAACQECLDVLLPALPHGLEILKGEASDCARTPDK